MSEKSDEVIALNVCDGEVDDFGVLITRYQNKLHRYVSYLLSSDSYSDDIVQDTFIKAYTNLRSFNPKRSFGAWIYRIAHNEAINTIKKHKKELLGEKDSIEAYEYKWPIEDATAEKLDNEKLRIDITEALSSLELKYRAPLELNLLEGLSYKEISEVLSLPLNTVATRIKRAKEQTKQVLKRKGVKR